MKFGEYAALAVILLALGSALYSLQLRLDMSKGEGAAEGFMYLPDPEHLKVASLGYDELVADLLWLKAVQNMGEFTISSQGYDWIYKALDTVTTLDPKFVQAYETGGLILTLVADKVDLSNRLFEKAALNNPDVWQFKYYLGFNHFYFMKDYPAAAKYIKQASEIPGSPKYLPMLASRLYVQADEISTSLSFLQTMYERVTDERARRFIMDRVNQLRAINTARALQKVVDEYEKINGRYPEDIAALVREGIIDRVPEEPNGGHYYIDRDGEVKSSRVRSTLGVHAR